MVKKWPIRGSKTSSSCRRGTSHVILRCIWRWAEYQVLGIGLATDSNHSPSRGIVAQVVCRASNLTCPESDPRRCSRRRRALVVQFTARDLFTLLMQQLQVRSRTRGGGSHFEKQRSRSLRKRHIELVLCVPTTLLRYRTQGMLHNRTHRLQLLYKQPGEGGNWPKGREVSRCRPEHRLLIRGRNLIA